MSAPLPLRVMVHDVWAEVQLELPPSTTIVELKHRALTSTHVARDPAGYVVKFRGFELLDEYQTLADHGVVPNANLIVLSRRRRPVR